MKQEHKVSKELVDRMIGIHFPFSGNPYEVTVMEMLDVMPKDYADTFVSSFKITIDMKNEAQGATVSVTKNGATIYKEFIGNFPNALAEMILWLVENNYISFNK